MALRIANIAITRERRFITIVTAFILCAAATKVLYGTAGYYFFSDDFLNFIIAKDMGATLRYFARDAQGEFIPLFRAMNIIYINVFGLAFWPFRIMSVGFQCAVVLLTAGLAYRRNVRPEILVPTLVLVAFSPIFESSYQWWSAAINVLAEALSCLAAIYIVAGTQELTVRQKALAACCFTAGLCFFPKAVFSLILFVGIRIFAALERHETEWMNLVRSVIKEVWPFFACAAIYTAFVILGDHSVNIPRPDFLSIPAYIWEGWNHGFLIGVLGLDAAFPGRVWLANLAVLLLVGVSIRRDPKAAVLWGAFFVYFVVVLAAIAYNRERLLGFESSRTARYYADILLYFAALVVLAFSRPRSGTVIASRPGVLTAVMLLTTVASIHLFRASARVGPVWFAPGARVSDFVQNISSSLESSSAATSIANDNVPGWVMPEWTSPLRHYAYFLLLFRHHGPVVDPSLAAMRFDAAGRLIPLSRDRSP